MAVVNPPNVTHHGSILGDLGGVGQVEEEGLRVLHVSHQHDQVGGGHQRRLPPVLRLHLQLVELLSLVVQPAPEGDRPRGGVDGEQVLGGLQWQVGWGLVKVVGFVGT